MPDRRGDGYSSAGDTPFEDLPAPRDAGPADPGRADDVVHLVAAAGGQTSLCCQRALADLLPADLATDDPDAVTCGRGVRAVWVSLRRRGFRESRLRTHVWIRGRRNGHRWVATVTETGDGGGDLSVTLTRGQRVVDGTLQFDKRVTVDEVEPWILDLLRS